MKDELDFALNVADYAPLSVSNGPGRRFVLWVQGCPFRCIKCSNEQFLEFRSAKKMRVRDVLAIIFSQKDIEGVTISGGEPMSQAQGLCQLAAIVRSKGLGVVCFSGYTFHELQSRGDKWQLKFLSEIDLLIDGRFDWRLPGSGMKASANQQLHFLSDRYASQVDDLLGRRTVELEPGKESWRFTGIYEDELVERLRRVISAGPRKLITVDE